MTQCSLVEINSIHSNENGQIVTEHKESYGIIDEDTQRLDTQTLSTQTLDTQTLDTQTLSTQTLDDLSIDSEITGAAKTLMRLSSPRKCKKVKLNIDNAKKRALAEKQTKKSQNAKKPNRRRQSRKRKAEKIEIDEIEQPKTKRRRSARIRANKLKEARENGDNCKIN